VRPNPEEATTLARRIAERLVSSSLAGGGSLPDGERPSPHFGGGDLGVAFALLHAGEILDEERYLTTAHALLRRAALATADQSLAHAKLFGGTAGFAWVLAEFARREPRYIDSLHHLAAELSVQVLTTPLPDPAMALYSYDVISGSAGQLAGVLAVAEAVANIGDQDLLTGLRDAAERLTGHLMTVTSVDDDGRPLWYLPIELLRMSPVTAWRAERYPYGTYDLGFAHGLPGILAALCRADTHGLGGGLLSHRAGELVGWLRRQATWNDAGPSWAASSDVDPRTRLPIPASGPPGRAAWCYGPPGVASALLPAAAVTGDADTYAMAVAALERTAARPAREQGCVSPTICHGHAGLLAIYTRAYAQTGLPAFAAARDAQVAEVSALASDENPYIFADITADGEPEHKRGFLEGAAGVMLALLGTCAGAAGRWDEFILLTPAELGETAAAKYGNGTTT
jgi:hypothetical protein